MLQSQRSQKNDGAAEEDRCLLDFSRDPLIAAYFAAENPD
jgi:hypothetical protein